MFLRKVFFPCFTDINSCKCTTKKSLPRSYYVARCKEMLSVNSVGSTKSNLRRACWKLGSDTVHLKTVFLVEILEPVQSHITDINMLKKCQLRLLQKKTDWPVVISQFKDEGERGTLAVKVCVHLKNAT